MTNKISLVLGLLIVGVITVDATMFDGTNLLFLARKLSELIEWIAFWR